MANQNVPTHIFGGGVSLKSNTYPSSAAADITSGGFAPTAAFIGSTVTAINYGNQGTATPPSVTPASTAIGAKAPGVLLCSTGGSALAVTLPPSTEFIGQTLTILVNGLTADAITVNKNDGVTAIATSAAITGGASVTVVNYSAPTLTNGTDYSSVFVSFVGNVT